MSTRHALFVLALIGCVLYLSVQADDMENSAVVNAGREIAFAAKKINCLSCHLILKGHGLGNISVAMKARFPDKKVLRDNVWDQTQFRPHAMMPPFGKHRILTEEEIDNIAEFLYTL